MWIIRNLAGAIAALGLTILGASQAFAELPAGTIGTETLPFPPSPHRAYLIDVEFESMIAGRVVVVDPDQKKMLGMISTGFTAPSALSHDGKTIYAADIFYSRGTRGARTDVLTAWDTSTLSPAWEVIIPAKRVMSLTQRYSIGSSPDDRFVYVYNFTPATSVTIVNAKTKLVASEIAIPGCVLTYPVGKRGIASICGDGSIQLVTIDEGGKEISRTRTKFFDPNAEKLVERAVNVGDTYYFTTTTGTIRAIDMSGKQPKVLPEWELVTKAEDKKAGWAPGGWQLLAVSPKLNQLYVIMHDQHEPMKWEDPSPVIWAFDLKTHKHVGTLEAPNPVWSLRATTDNHPLLLGTNVTGGLEIFDLKTGKHTGTMDKISKTPSQILTH